MAISVPSKKEVEVIKFDAAGLFGGILMEGKTKPSNLGLGAGQTRTDIKSQEIQVQCFPLYSVLQALKNPHVDYFSLDIEGAEMVVLETLPWSKVNMTLLSVEINHAGDIFPGTRQDIHEKMKKEGFELASTVYIHDEKDKIRTDLPLDDFFYSKKNNRFLPRKKSKKNTKC